MMKCYLALAAVLVGGVVFADRVDPRVRTFVDPVRVVWQRPAEEKSYTSRFSITGAEWLLEHSTGQVPVGGWNNGLMTAGCKLVNAGAKPGIILDFGRELHGGIQIGVGVGKYDMKLRLRFGESVAETMSNIGEKGATNDHAIRDTVLTVPAFGMIEFGNTGFRFVRIDLETFGDVRLEFVRAISLMRPMEKIGYFKSSDERLNRIFDTAVHTVHLCCQDYLWDGIKRDRLVWMGDTHPESMGILSVFGAQPVLSESLDLMTTVTKPTEYMNNFGVYTLWWVRNVAEWYRFTGDKAYLEKHHDYLKATLANLSRSLTPSNTFEGTFKMFLDWPSEHNQPAIFAGVQANALITFREGAYLAEQLGDVGFAADCRKAAQRLETLKGKLDPNGSKQAAAMLALSGLADADEMYASILGKNGIHGVSTFYGYYMIEAMCAADKRQQALDTVRDYWGAMLDVGATSFWEDFNIDWTNNCFRIDELPVAGKKDIHGDYGEFCYPGFRHSFCHGWSCGPAPWLIHNVLGINIVEAGCKVVAVKPFLGDLDWAEGAMALPDGKAIKVSVKKTAGGELDVKIDAPEGVKIIR